ncbi:MAG: hypothetical protein N2509_08125, partial [Treponemataceae bacterium]|nr:hypothetical protein [Treponemataceae bacterium]
SPSSPQEASQSPIGPSGNELFPEAPSPLVPSEIPAGKTSVPPPLELFRYLKELTEQLPEEQKRAFQRSEARLKMEYVMEKLEGQGGLLRKAEERMVKEKTEEVPLRASPGAAQGLPPVSETLRYLRSMAGNLPDPDLSQVMGKKLEKVLKSLNGKGGTRDT